MATIKRVIDSQRKFFRTGKTKDIQFRYDALKRLLSSIEKNEQNLVQALKQDFKKCDFETFITEFSLVKIELKHTIRKLKRWVKPEKVRSSLLNFPSRDVIISEPFGVALIISPWNYPFYLTFSPLIGAISAGNCAIIKPSELTPNVSKLMAKIISDTFSPEFITLIEGDEKVSKNILEQRFDFIFFTGSTQVGRIIQQAAAQYLTPTVLELGGKSPCIVDETANLKIAAKRITWGKFINAGQTCVAPDYLLVHKSIEKPLLKNIKKCIIDFYGVDPQKSSDFPRIINTKNFDRILSLLDQGKIYFGGEVNSKEHYISPTILQGVKNTDKIMQEEIFGPILPVLTYDKLDESIQFIVKSEKPLALYLFTSNNSTKQKVLAETSSGGVAINDTVSHLINDKLPFGGVGESGMGSYHGKASFCAFSHQKSAMDKKTWHDNPLRYPPYSKGKLKFAKRLINLIS